MNRFVKFTLALAVGTALVSPIPGAGQASAGECHYTSQDKAKGYKC